jgi:acetyl esterase
MPLDPILVPIVAGLEPTPEHVDDYEELRRSANAALNAALVQVAEPGPEVASVEDVTIPVDGGSIGLRIWRPFGQGPRPMHLFVHGGGWTTGSAFDALSDINGRERAALAGNVVVAVDYRTAPEHKFPVPFNDVYAALTWMDSHREELGGNQVLTVGGHSAGANLAAGVALKARDEGGPRIDLQILEVPLLDATATLPSHERNALGYGLTAEEVVVCVKRYLGSHVDRVDPYVSPLLAPDLTGLPPALVISAEYDPLCDDGQQYVERLLASGVRATFSLQLGQVHVSHALTKVSPAARAWRDQVIKALQSGANLGDVY